jgi:hypothetical protein
MSAQQLGPTRQVIQMRLSRRLPLATRSHRRAGFRRRRTDQPWEARNLAEDLVRSSEMARPAKDVPTSLEEALAKLKRDPANAVHARIDGLDVELRVVPPSSASDEKLGDWMASAGPWQGETEEEILEILREARRAGGTAEPLEMP